MNRCCLLLLLASSLPAAEALRQPLDLRSPLQDKNFYLLSAIERTPAVRALVQSDPSLAALAAAKRTSLSEAVRSCAANVPCYANALRWSDAEIAQSREALQALMSKPPIHRFAEGQLREAGVFQRYHDRPAGELLAQAWDDAAAGINRAIDTYALGQAPRYAAIDAPTYDVKSANFGRTVQIMAAVLDDGSKSLELFFQPSLRFALELLMAQQRYEAARHEPLETGENRAAVRRVPSIRWAQFPYTVIVVPGSGPDRAGVALSPVGRLRLILAAKRFREGKAPFILVSGGYVHPNLTTFNEALEMKKALRTEFGIPEDAILVDPHARHTTTNLRNAARQIYRYNFPFDRKALIVTDQLQSAYIQSDPFAERCNKELGYQPHRLLGRVSAYDLEFTPVIDSLQADAADLLDP